MIMPEASPTLPAAPLDNAGELRVAVRRFIGARVGDAATADDLTQEVFVKVQKRSAQVRDPRRLMGWVIQIARNTVADFFRGARATEPFKEEHAAHSPVQPESFDREETQLRTELSTYVRSVVESLPAIYREALVLTEYDGLSQVELARHLGLSVSAAKSRVQRARAAVREIIDRCCHFDVDHYGTVVECTPRETRCKCGVQKRQTGRAR
jgi:RNA polymerase sigma-70 factor (ECF subfamily)